MNNLVFTANAWEDYLYRQTQDYNAPKEQKPLSRGDSH
jgi:Txe/YoeB family toxin of Txe-Axe toxin-antitoxin module